MSTTMKTKMELIELVGGAWLHGLGVQRYRDGDVEVLRVERMDGSWPKGYSSVRLAPEAMDALVTRLEGGALPHDAWVTNRALRYLEIDDELETSGDLV